MAYCGYVARLKNLHKHPNADRLQIGECFGNSVIVSLDYVNEQLGVYFPVDGQLSVRFCAVNNLVRRKDENGNEVGGYMDPDKRNIKAIKLRGEQSDGLFLPLTCLTDFTTVSELREGDTITTLNGEEICCKYIPHTNAVARSKAPSVKKAKVNFAPTFYEHVDTAQLAYNLNQFKAGDVIELTLKMHGCFIKDTKVRMADGTLKAIQDIKIGDRVLGYDLQNKKVVPTTVLNTFKNAPSSKWNRIKLSRNHILGDKRGTQTSTWNHKYWVEEKHKWVMAKDLKVGETISTLFPSPVLTNLQKELCLGLALGDGYLVQFDDKVAEIQVGQKTEKKEFLEWLQAVSQKFFYMMQEKISGYGTNMATARCMRSADLYNYVRDCFTFNHQDCPRLKEGLIDKITPLSLALWYMSDGSLAHSDSQKDRALLAICRYTTSNDLQIIEKCFNKFSIYPTLFTDANGYNRIRFSRPEAVKLFDLIQKYILPCMRYKLPEEYQNQYFESPIDNEEFVPNGYVLSPQTVLENKEVNQTYVEYDLETELHNYIVGLSIVHNTSGRTGYLPLLRTKRTWLDKLLHRHGKDYREYGYVSGTRRVVLDENHDGGFYETNDFRRDVEYQFLNKLHKGEVVYYEIVGFIDNGTPIMGSVKNSKIRDKAFSKLYGDETVFSYGCAPDGSALSAPNPDGEPLQHDVYVYRMTMVNEDGDVVEMSPDQMRYRCEQMGVKTVPLFERFIVPDEVDAGEYVVRKVEEYFAGPDPIGKTHVREGVVARIVNRNSIAVYKHKNFEFKVLEGICKDEATAPDMEEAQEEKME